MFEGFIKAPVAGVYEFALISDDGAKVWIDGMQTVDNDGRHGAKRSKGAVALAAGFHRLRLGFFDGIYGERLDLEWSGPGFAISRIPGSVLFHTTSE